MDYAAIHKGKVDTCGFPAKSETESVRVHRGSKVMSLSGGEGKRARVEFSSAAGTRKK